MESHILTVFFLLTLLSFTLSQNYLRGKESNETLLEYLAYKYGTDKSHDDHKYTDFYSSLFMHIRHSIRNMTEIGVAAGQSIQCWYDYFPNSQIHGFDIGLDAKVKENLLKLDRVKLYVVDVTKPGEVEKLGFENNTMDIIIDDAGGHTRDLQEKLLAKMWPFVKLGGHYIMEDVDGQRGGFDYEKMQNLAPLTVSILENNHAFIVNPTVGHRAWKLWLERSTTDWAVDRRVHNSYLLVIRKRRGEVPVVKMNYGEVAMDPNKIVGSDQQVLVEVDENVTSATNTSSSTRK
jgi:hypothetical protein